METPVIDNFGLYPEAGFYTNKKAFTSDEAKNGTKPSFIT
jgi:hypothetical protein